MIRCPDKYWASKQLIHTSMEHSLCHSLLVPRIYHLWLAVLQFMDHWQLFSISAHWGSHANCISGCLFSRRIHMVVTHCIVLAIFITLNSSWPRQVRLWEPAPGDFPVLFEAILWLFLLHYTNSHWALIYDLEENEKKGGKHLWEQGFCRLNLSLSKPKLTAQLSEAERHQCQDTQPRIVRASTE